MPRAIARKSLGTSIGLYLHKPTVGNPHTDIGQMLVAADRAMFAAKRSGKGRLSLANPVDVIAITKFRYPGDEAINENLVVSARMN